MSEPWASWQAALDGYRYPVDFTTFSTLSGTEKDGNWCSIPIPRGDRAETMTFEDRFRLNAPDHLQAWYEVVFWKVPNPFKQQVTSQFIQKIRSEGVTAKRLWDECRCYIENPTKARFRSFQRLVVDGQSIAVAATFPAFVAPNLFPMVDTRTAKWVTQFYQEQNSANRDVPALVRPPHFGIVKWANVLTLADYTFMDSWIKWCRWQAKQLSEQAETLWRPRDVEMAVFEGWGDKKERKHPHRQLPPIPTSANEDGQHQPRL